MSNQKKWPFGRSVYSKRPESEEVREDRLVKSRNWVTEKSRTETFETWEALAEKFKLQKLRVAEIMKENGVPYFYKQIDGERTRIYCYE